MMVLNFRTALLKYRFACDMSQSEMAKELNVSESGYRNWESDDFIPSGRALLDMAESMGMELSEFIAMLEKYDKEG